MSKKQNLAAGLESNANENASVETVVVVATGDYSKEALEATEFVHNAASASSKYDAEREPKVQEGLKLIADLMGDKINPLVILLGKHWENKNARAAIKSLIDEEAKAKGVPSDVYLQVKLRENVDKLASVQNAVDRLRYSINYFKPRPGATPKDSFKQFTIGGVLYNVSLTKLDEAKTKFGEDKEAIKAFIVECSLPVEIDEI